MPPLITSSPPTNLPLSRSSSSSGSYLIDMGSVRLDDNESKSRSLRDSVRPWDGEEVRRAWHAHFSSPTTLSELRNRAIQKGGLTLSLNPHTDPSPPGSHSPALVSISGLGMVDGIPQVDDGRTRTKGAAGEEELGPLMRGVYWRIYLSTLPYPFTPSSTLQSHLSTQHKSYDSLRRRYLVAPDGRWAGDCTVVEGEEEGFGVGGRGEDQGGGLGMEERRSGRDVGKGKDRESVWDPLDLGESNPWQLQFHHQSLRLTILKDIERTFPSNPYFLDPSIRKIMMTILFIWSIQPENEVVGYRQGMHELLGVCLMVIDRDCWMGGDFDAKAEGSGVRAGRGAHFDPLENDDSMARRTSSTSNGTTVSESSMLMNLILNPSKVEHEVYHLFSALMARARVWYEWRSSIPSGSGGPQPSSPVPPTTQKIVMMCNRLQGEKLRRVDPVLCAKLEAEGIEGQLWGIRYIRLLFTREMPLIPAMRLWDGLFAEDPELTDMVEAICLAMLLRIRSSLLQGDYASVLTHLLRYPADSPELPLVPDMLLHQALSLRRDPSAATGANIVLQNQEVLGISPAVVAEEEVSHLGPTGGAHRGRKRGSGPQGSPRGGMAPRASGTKFDTLARGLMERAQASGLDKTIYSAVSEIRKNLPEFPTTPSTAFQFRTFSSPSEEEGYSNIPSMQQAIPPPPVRTLRDADLEIAELRLSLINMGKAMDKWLEVVKPSSASNDPAEAQNDQAKDTQSEAWKGMNKLRDALLNAAVEPASEMAREWAWSLGEPEQRKSEALEQLAHSQPQAVSILGQARAGHVKNLSNGVIAATTSPVDQAARPSPKLASPAVLSPIESRLAGLVQGTSPRQFAFPSPFAGTTTSGRSDWNKHRPQAIPIPPPTRQTKIPITTSGDEVLFERPATPDSGRTPVVESYPPSKAGLDEEPVNIDPLSGMRTMPITRMQHPPPRKAIRDPLLGIGL